MAYFVFDSVRILIPYAVCFTKIWLLAHVVLPNTQYDQAIVQSYLLNSSKQLTDTYNGCTDEEKGK